MFSAVSDYMLVHIIKVLQFYEHIGFFSMLSIPILISVGIDSFRSVMYEIFHL